MSLVLSCDACGRPIRDGTLEQVQRLRLLRIDPSHNWMIAGPMDGWDFCSIGCVATWATDLEMRHAGPMPP